MPYVPSRRAADLESALSAGTLDVVLANVTQAPELERARRLGHNAVVLPAIYLVAPGAQPISKQQSKADRRQSLEGFVVIVRCQAARDTTVMRWTRRWNSS